VIKRQSPVMSHFQLKCDFCVYSDHKRTFLNCERELPLQVNMQKTSEKRPPNVCSKPLPNFQTHRLPFSQPQETSSLHLWTDTVQQVINKHLRKSNENVHYQWTWTKKSFKNWCSCKCRDWLQRDIQYILKLTTTASQYQFSTWHHLYVCTTFRHFLFTDVRNYLTMST